MPGSSSDSKKALLLAFCQSGIATPGLNRRVLTQKDRHDELENILMLSQVIGEALIVGFQGLVLLGLFLFLQSLWRDLAVLFSGKESL